ncbi:MAG: DUF308 domain-containing protein [Clostridia bacterium]|nr:DUF308 domain-containing protein [Clostridia bacterium]
MGLVKKIKEINWGYLWLALLIGGAGILILAYPNKTLDVVAITVGVVTLLLGAVQAIRVLSDKKRGFKFAVGIVAASVTVIAGVLCLILRDKVKEFIPSLVCLFLVIDASFKLQTVVRARQFKSKACWALMVLSIVTITLSFITIRLEGGEDVKKILILFGLSLVADALGNLFSFFFVGSVEKAEREKILAENSPEPPAPNAEQTAEQ